MSLKDRLLPENRVKIVETVGVGAYGQVFRCLVTTAGETQNKIVKRNYVDHTIDFIGSIRELDVFAKVSHPYVVATEFLSTGLIENEKSTLTGFKPDNIYFIMELGAYDCHNMIYSRKVSFHVLKEAMVHLLLGVLHIHDLGYTHADIKPRNCIWFRDGSARYMKIADFGLCRPNFKNLPKSPVTMTPSYRAPELVLENTFYDGEKIDAWGLGCTFYEMISGETYINTRSDNNRILRNYLNSAPNTATEMMTKCFANKATRTLFDDAFGVVKRKQFVNLLTCLLTKNPAKRMTVKEALKHPFFHEENKFIQKILSTSHLNTRDSELTVHAITQREQFSRQLRKLITTEGNPYDFQYIFHALRVFDTVVDRILFTAPPHSETEWKIIKYTCIYLSRKYFDEHESYSMEDFLNKTFYESYYSDFGEMELYILNDILEFRFYEKSLFEGIFDDHADAVVSHDNVLFVFDEYASLVSGAYILSELAAEVYEKLPEKKEVQRISHVNLQNSKLIKPVLNKSLAYHHSNFTTRNETHAQIGEYTGRKERK